MAAPRRLLMGARGILTGAQWRLVGAWWRRHAQWHAASAAHAIGGAGVCWRCRRRGAAASGHRPDAAAADFKGEAGSGAAGVAGQHTLTCTVAARLLLR